MAISGILMQEKLQDIDINCLEETAMWAFESVFYQIYPLGFSGAPFENDGQLTHRILKVNDWIPHMKKLGINAIYFSRSLSRIPMVIIREIITPSTAGWEPTRILRRSAISCMRTASK